MPELRTPDSEMVCLGWGNGSQMLMTTTFRNTDPKTFTLGDSAEFKMSSKTLSSSLEEENKQGRGKTMNVLMGRYLWWENES
jgi:hypothetical protein